VDLISTTALASADKRPAVTVTISVDFFAPLPIGEDLVVESHMVKAGKTLTFAEVSFRWAAELRTLLMVGDWTLSAWHPTEMLWM